MEEREVQQLLIEILYATVNETEQNDSIKQKITPDNLISVYRLAKQHDLAHVVADFVDRNQIEVDAELQAKLQREALLSVYRHEQMKYAFAQICAAFDDAGIAYIPLKGAVIRPYYPYESMRTSCDIDVLIHEKDIDTAIPALEAMGCRCGERNYHDVSLYSPNKIHLELHFSIQENMDNLDAVLKDAWDYAVQKNGSQYAFSEEFFAFHMFAHMAYHFVSGGCGIRALLDIWVMEHRMGISHFCARALLERAGIYRFATEMSGLAERCFSRNDADAFADSILKYIFRGGVYGSVQNHVAVDQSKNDNRVAYVFKRLFPSYKSMTVPYPLLKKAPYLLPFCWVARWMRALFGGKSKRIVSEVAYVNRTSDETIREVKEICSRLGL